MVPDRWLVLSARLLPPGDTSLAADLLVTLGARAVEERGQELVTHLPPPDDPEQLAAEARLKLQGLPGVEDVEISWRWQPHEAWSDRWKRDLAPRRVGERLVVAPSWTRPDLREGDLLIRIDPGIAFGTAGHATTRGCLRLVEKVVPRGDRVVDVGAGSGILSIAAALLGAGSVVAVEDDPYACGAARENVGANGVDGRVRVVERRLDAEGLAEMNPADGVVANIRTEVLRVLLPGAARLLPPDGWLVLGGVPEPERGGLTEAAHDRGFDLVDEVLEDGWWSGLLRRRE